jgi:hypothetical protein
MVMKKLCLSNLSWCGLVLLLMAAAGCVTQSYGRMPEVGDAEKTNLDCSEIAREWGKVRDYRNNVARQGTVNSGSDVLGFLTDFGAGNNMEKEGALNAADRRSKQLRALYAQKGCR